METTESQILAFASAQWGGKDLKGIGLKLAEEAGEVAGALVKLPEGRATTDDLDDEMGDMLIVLSQLAAKRGKTLEELRAARFAHIQEKARLKAYAALAATIAPEVWAKMDAYDRDWVSQSVDGTLPESAREEVEAGILDAEMCGNSDVAAVLRAVIYQPDDACPYYFLMQAHEDEATDDRGTRIWRYDGEGAIAVKYADVPKGEDLWHRASRVWERLYPDRRPWAQLPTGTQQDWMEFVKVTLTTL